MAQPQHKPTIKKTMQTWSTILDLSQNGYMRHAVDRMDAGACTRAAAYACGSNMLAWQRSTQIYCQICYPTPEHLPQEFWTSL